MPRALSSPSRESRTRLPAWGAAVLALAGAVDAAVLARIHVRAHTDPAYRSFCAFSEELSCDTVALSEWSVFLGAPVALWGLLGYLAMGMVAVDLARRPPDRRAETAGLLLLLAAGAVAASVVLLVVTWVHIRSACPLCMVAHAVNTGIFVLAAVAARRLGGARRVVREAAELARRAPVRAAAAGVLALLGATCLSTGVTPYWAPGPAAETARPDGLAAGSDPELGHWIGARSPTVVVVEFSDYQCPHCRRGHLEARALVSASPETLRLVHRHFPLDDRCNPALRRPFHRRACELAAFAHCAGEQGRFWEANDRLFELGRDPALDLGRLAAELELDRSALEACMGSERTAEAIAHDLEAGAAAGVRGTPTFFVDGRAHPGRLPPEVVEAGPPAAPSG